MISIHKRMDSLYHYVSALGRYSSSFAWIALHWRLIWWCYLIESDRIFWGRQSEGVEVMVRLFHAYLETDRHSTGYTSGISL